MIKIISYLMLVVLGIGAYFISIHRLDIIDKEKLIGVPIPFKHKVVVKTVKKQPLTEWAFAEGTALAKRRDFLQFEAAGRVIAIGTDKQRNKIRAGSFVHKGMMLARLDNRTAVANVLSAKSEIDRLNAEGLRADSEVQRLIANKVQMGAEIKRAEAEVKRTQADIASAKSQKNQAKSQLNLAKKDFKRNADLYKKRIIPRSNYDQSRSELDRAQAAFNAATSGIRSTIAVQESARANLTAAKSVLQQADASISGAKAAATSTLASVRAAEANADKSQVNESYFELLAPFSGLISQINIREGDITVGNTGAMTDVKRESNAAIVMINTDKFEVELNLPQWREHNVEIGQTVYLAPAGNSSISESMRAGFPSGSVAIGEIKAVSPSISLNKRSIILKAETIKKSTILKDGLFVTAWIETKKRDAILSVSWDAIHARENGQYVFVLGTNGKTVEQREIQTGMEGLGRVEVVKGIKVGDQIVVKGAASLTHGSPVTVVGASR